MTHTTLLKFGNKVQIIIRHFKPLEETIPWVTKSSINSIPLPTHPGTMLVGLVIWWFVMDGDDQITFIHPKLQNLNDYQINSSM
jgi:hypothetical protein